VYVARFDRLRQMPMREAAGCAASGRLSWLLVLVSWASAKKTSVYLYVQAQASLTGVAGGLTATFKLSTVVSALLQHKDIRQQIKVHHVATGSQAKGLFSGGSLCR